MFMKESYRIAFLVLFITETLTYELFFTEKKEWNDIFYSSTSQYAIQSYRNKSTIYDCIPGGALVGFTFKMFHSPLAAVVATIQGSIMG
jgi:hypothetical protein